MTLLDVSPGVIAPSPVPSRTPAQWPVSETFANPLYPGADPWVTRHGGAYYLCQATHGGQIVVSRSESPLHPGRRATVWTPPRRGWNRAQVWAPELHRIGDRWYIYYAASDGHNRNHRMGVLESVTDDAQGEYVDRGMIYTGDHVESGEGNRWAIDGTVLRLNGQLYFLWSGWHDHRDVQYLYIARMSNPWTVCSNRVRLCANDTYRWERVSDSMEERGLNEAPQVIVRDGRVCVVYSCSGSWQPTYKLGLLHMDVAGDPMEAGSWVKHPLPLFESTPEVFGVGHCSFVESPDGREDWVIYHAKTSRRAGWSDRVVRAQPFTWSKDQLPHLGQPVPNGVAVGVPSGLHQEARELAMAG